MGERDLDRRVGERVLQGVGPLHERDCALGHLEREAELLVVHRPEPVRIEVRDRDVARVPLRDRERRARHVLPDPEGPRGAPYERRLPRPQLAVQSDDIAGREDGGDRRADRLGLRGAGGPELDQNRPSCSGSSACGAEAAPASDGSRVGASASNGASAPPVAGAGAGSGLPINPGMRAKSASSVASIDGV